MKQEFPSSPREAFESANEGLYYGAQFSKIRANGSICKVPYDDAIPVYTSWDIGLNDFTSIWCFQIARGGEIRIINFHENWDEAPKYYCEWLLNQKYRFAKHIFPHDALQRDKVKTTYIDHVRPFLNDQFAVLDIKDCDKLVGIQTVRSILGRCVFDEEKCSVGIKHMEAYRKIWDEKLGCYKNSPLHDLHSNAADSFRYLAVGLRGLEAGGRGSTENDLKAVNRYFNT
jgi:hypothetical protein